MKILLIATFKWSRRYMRVIGHQNFFTWMFLLFIFVSIFHLNVMLDGHVMHCGRNPPPLSLSLSLSLSRSIIIWLVSLCLSFPMGILGFCPYFAKITAICPYFETIKVHVPVLKLDFNKIELQVELDISNVEFYA